MGKVQLSPRQHVGSESQDGRSTAPPAQVDTGAAGPASRYPQWPSLARQHLSDPRAPKNGGEPSDAPSSKHWGLYIRGHTMIPEPGPGEEAGREELGG